MRILKLIALVGKFTDGQFMGGWIDASIEENHLEFEYLTNWVSSDSGYERGCSQEDIDLHHKSQAQLKPLKKRQILSAYSVIFI